MKDCTIQEVTLEKDCNLQEAMSWNLITHRDQIAVVGLHRCKAFLRDQTKNKSRSQLKIKTIEIFKAFKLKRCTKFIIRISKIMMFYFRMNLK